MKHARVLALCSLGALIAPALWAQGAPRELKLGTASASMGSTASVSLTLKSDSQVQGLVALADWDGALLEGTDLVAEATLAEADVVVRRTAKTYFALGVVMDSDGQGGEIIQPGNNILVATLKVKALGPSAPPEKVTPIVFQDGKYNTADSGPLLDNILVIGGLSVGKAEGLALTNGSVTLRPPAPGKFTIVNSHGAYGTTIRVPVQMDNSSAVAGFVTAITHPSGPTLNRILIGPAVPANPDFQQADIFANGGTLGVVLELDGQPPFRTIAPGTAQTIAFYEYSEGSCPNGALPAKQYDLKFSNNVLGDPLKENVMVVGTASINPELVNGRLTVDPCPEAPVSELSFRIGSCAAATDRISVVKGTASNPGTFPVGFWYLSPEDNEPDEAKQMDHIQGISMAACYDLKCLSCVGTYSLVGTITDAVGTEFVNVDCENEVSDGDAGELVIGILVDALPPFDGQDLPPTEEYLKLVCVDFMAGSDSTCTNCGGDVEAIKFCEAKGRGQVVIKNLASIMNQAVAPKNLFNGKLSYLGENAFIRGDCNTSGSVDIADAASVISALFYTGTWKYEPTCDKACDANDDGRMDLADSVFLLRYLFRNNEGALNIKPPYPAAGADPTVDKLTCGDTEDACP